MFSAPKGYYSTSTIKTKKLKNKPFNSPDTQPSSFIAETTTPLESPNTQWESIVDPIVSPQTVSIDISDLRERLVNSIRAGDSTLSVLTLLDQMSNLDVSLISSILHESISEGSNFKLALAIFDWCQTRRPSPDQLSQIETTFFGKMIESKSVLAILALQELLSKSESLESYRKVFQLFNSSSSSRAFQLQCTSSLNTIITTFIDSKLIEKNLDSEILDSTLLEASRISITLANTKHLATLIALLTARKGEKGDDTILQLVYVLQIRYLKEHVPTNKCFESAIKIIDHMRLQGLKPGTLVLANLILCCSTELEYNQVISLVSKDTSIESSAAIQVATIFYRLVSCTDVDKAELAIGKLAKIDREVGDEDNKLIEQIGIDLITSQDLVQRNVGLRIIRFYLVRIAICRV